MLQFDYEIRLDENGEPFVQLSKHYEEVPEDKFMVFDIVSRLVSMSLSNVEFRAVLSDDHIKAIEICNQVLYAFKKDIGTQIKKRMIERGEDILNKPKEYQIEVSTIEKRNSLNYNGIIYEDKIYRREVGLRVLVLETMKVYELKDGIDNTNWSEVK